MADILRSIVVQDLVRYDNVGLQGIPGLGATDALAISNRLSEFSTPEAKAAARQNLEIDIIDGGTF